MRSESGVERDDLAAVDDAAEPHQHLVALRQFEESEVAVAGHHDAGQPVAACCVAGAAAPARPGTDRAAAGKAGEDGDGRMAL